MNVALYVQHTKLHPQPGMEKAKYPAFIMDCPACGKAGHLSMRAATGRWHCFHCLAGGGFPLFVSLVEKIPIRNAVQQIKRQELSSGTGGDVLSLQAISSVVAEEDGELVTCSLPPEIVYLHSHPYLESRLVSPAETARHHLGACFHGFYKGRIIIPIFEYGRPLGFVARDFTGTPTFDRKILNPTISMSMMVWNIDIAFKYKRVVVCEGVFSALRVGEDAVATFGKNFSPAQAYKLRDFGVKELVLMYDSDVNLWDAQIPDPNNVRRRLRNPMPDKLSFLSSVFTLRIVELPTGDPGDHSRDYLRTLIDTAPLYQGPLRTLKSL